MAPRFESVIRRAVLAHTTSSPVRSILAIMSSSLLLFFNDGKPTSDRHASEEHRGRTVSGVNENLTAITQSPITGPIGVASNSSFSISGFVNKSILEHGRSILIPLFSGLPSKSVFKQPPISSTTVRRNDGVQKRAV